MSGRVQLRGPLSSTIGDTISCDAPYSTIGFRGKVFLRCPPSKACLWTDSLRYHRKHSATGVLLHLSRDGGDGISVGLLS